MNNWIKNIQSFFCAPTCVLCGQTSANNLCTSCEPGLPHLQPACSCCALPFDIDMDQATLCGECIADPPPFNRVLAPFRYQQPINEMIGRFKYQGALYEGRVLGDYLAQYITQQTHPSCPIDLLLPIPLHRSRLRQRGFNQAAELALWLSRKLAIPWHSGLLHRRSKDPEQRSAKRRERQRNVRRAFSLSTKAALPKRIALIDDVVTTGATVRAAAQCLRQAGVDYIEVWAVARTPKK